MSDTFFQRWEQADRDLSRGADAPTSQEAFERIKPHRDSERGQILAWLRERGADGGSAKEYAKEVGRPFNAISGRWSELKLKGRIRPTGLRRDGAMVYVVNPEVST